MTTITRERLLKIQQWRETYGPGSNVVLPAEEAEELARIALASLDAGSDSNNHPAHGPLSDYRLHRIREILGKAAAQSDGGNIGYAMSDAVKAIDELLAGRKAEPVAWRYRTTDINGNPNPRWSFSEEASLMGLYQPLYTAPPAPVAIDERAEFNAWNNEDNLPIAGVGAKNAAWLAWQARAKLGSPTAPVVPEATCDDDGNTKSEFDHGWNACRAAMLNHSGRVTDMVEHVSQPYKLPPHVYRELVNQLHSTAMKYSGCQQLREQISRTLGTVLGPAHSHIK
ncbi:TPA: hypothetical protein ACNH1H_000395 [Citrobacter koseri]